MIGKDEDGPTPYQRYMERRYQGHCQQSRRHGREPLTRDQFTARVQAENVRRMEKPYLQTDRYYSAQDNGNLSAKQAALAVEDEDVSTHVLDKIVRQEGGTHFGTKTWLGLGNGCFWRAKKYG